MCVPIVGTPVKVLVLWINGSRNKSCFPALFDVDLVYPHRAVLSVSLPDVVDPGYRAQISDLLANHTEIEAFLLLHKIDVAVKHHDQVAAFLAGLRREIKPLIVFASDSMELMGSLHAAIDERVPLAEAHELGKSPVLPRRKVA